MRVKRCREKVVRAMGNSVYFMKNHEKHEIRTLWELQKYKRDGYRIVLYGCGGHARSIINTILKTGEKTELLLVDNNAGKGELIMGCQTANEYTLTANDYYIAAIGNNELRKRAFNYLVKEHIDHCISIVSASADIGIDVKIGRGTFIAANTYVGPQAVVGDNVIINTGSVVEHEVEIGSHTHIAPNATICGRTKIGSNVLCGTGATIIDKIEVCDDVIIGAGAVITENIMEAGTYVGVPARKIN